MHWFFFGSLIDHDVLAVVLDRSVTNYVRRPGTLHGYRRVCVIEESYPALIPNPHGRVEGLVVENLSEEDSQRICFFEGDEFQPRILPVELHDGRRLDARVFLTAGLSESLEDRPWDFHTWRIRHKTRFLAMARDFMAGYGHADWYRLDDQWKSSERASRRPLSVTDRTED